MRNVKAELSYADLECLSSWLRCYPVAGREAERKRLTAVVENAMKAADPEVRPDRFTGVPHKPFKGPY